MIITDALAQQIVDTAAGLVHCNVNIMNREGVIVGTGQPLRRHTVHRGALEVVESGGAVEIFAQDAILYPGAMEGVNLPIQLGDQVVGVIGVTGDPDAVRGIARLTKMVTELILEREQLHQESRSRQRLAEQLVEALLWGGPAAGRGRVARTARGMGLDMELARRVAVADVSAPIADFRQQYGGSELILERAADAILDGLAADGLLETQDVAVILDGRLIVLRAGGDDDIVPWGEAVAACCRRLLDTSVRLGLGAAARAIEEYLPSYRQALFCLQADLPGASSIEAPTLSVAWLMREAAAGPAGMVLRSKAAPLKQGFTRKPEMKATVEALFAHNFELEATAFTLGIHRNTLTYRLGRLKQMTGLDPLRRHDDAVLLRALLEAIRAL